MQIREIMSTPAISVGAEENVAVAARLLSRENVGVLPVCASDGALRGIVTDRDLVVRCIALEKDPSKTKVSDVMTTRIAHVTPSDEVEQLETCLCEHQVRRVPVTEDGRLVGMVSLADLARQPRCTMEAADCLCEIVAGVKHCDC